MDTQGPAEAMKAQMLAISGAAPILNTSGGGLDASPDTIDEISQIHAFTPEASQPRRALTELAPEVLFVVNNVSSAGRRAENVREEGNAVNVPPPWRAERRDIALDVLPPWRAEGGADDVEEEGPREHEPVPVAGNKDSTKRQLFVEAQRPEQEEEGSVQAASKVQSTPSTAIDTAFPRLTYKPELDGLRAFAVIPVVLYHFKLGFHGGFAGVDVFFVISGFLITAIILSDLSRNKFSMSNFWVRRCRRLFPALAMMLAVILAVGWHKLLGETYTKLADQTWTTLLFGANFHFYATTDYFANNMEQPLLHCWSLAAEEQFYLVFPLMLMALWPLVRRIGGTLVILGICIIMTAISLFFAVWYGERDKNFAYYLLPCRVWEMVLGGLIAFDRKYGKLKYILGPARIAECAALSGLGMIGASYFVLDENMPYPSYPALLPCMGTALFTAAVEACPGTVCSKVLSVSPAVFIGRMSYSLYLWHWPVYILLAYSTLDYKLNTGQTVLGLFLSFGAGFISFVFVEPAFRSAKKPAQEQPAIQQQVQTITVDNNSASTPPKVLPTIEGQSTPTSRLNPSGNIAAPSPLGSPIPGPAWAGAKAWTADAPAAQKANNDFFSKLAIPGLLSDQHFLLVAFAVWASLLLFSVLVSTQDIGGVRAELRLLCEFNCTDKLQNKFELATNSPSARPTAVPTYLPTAQPSEHPTLRPTLQPTQWPTWRPTVSLAPTITVDGMGVSKLNTSAPTEGPTAAPTFDPTPYPTLAPTTRPTMFPTFEPSVMPTLVPTLAPDLLRTCMQWLDEETINRACHVPAEQIVGDNIIASVAHEADFFNIFQYNYGLEGPKLLGPDAYKCMERGNTPVNCAGFIPEIVVTGNSHCAHLGYPFRKLANEYGVNVAILCIDGSDQGAFHLPLSEWDQTRVRHLSAWTQSKKLRMVVWADFWASYLPGKGMGLFDGTNPKLVGHFGYPFNFAYTFRILLEYGENLVVLGDVPTLPIDAQGSTGDGLLRNLVYNRGRAEGFGFLLKIQEQVSYRTHRLRTESMIQEAASSPEFNQQVKFVEMASYFERTAEDGNHYMQILDPNKGTLVYKDAGHLNEDGAMRLEQLFRRYVFGQPIC
jgi:peptidoglycan/LPS O-acetylase OafA/YrhL